MNSKMHMVNADDEIQNVERNIKQLQIPQTTSYKCCSKPIRKAQNLPVKNRNSDFI